MFKWMYPLIGAELTAVVKQESHFFTTKVRPAYSAHTLHLQDYIVSYTKNKKI